MNTNELDPINIYQHQVYEQVLFSALGTNSFEHKLKNLSFIINKFDLKHCCSKILTLLWWHCVNKNNRRLIALLAKIFLDTILALDTSRAVLVSKGEANVIVGGTSTPKDAATVL